MEVEVLMVIVGTVGVISVMTGVIIFKAVQQWARHRCDEPGCRRVLYLTTEVRDGRCVYHRQLAPTAKQIMQAAGVLGPPPNYSVPNYSSMLNSVMSPPPSSLGSTVKSIEPEEEDWTPTPIFGLRVWAVDGDDHTLVGARHVWAEPTFQAMCDSSTSWRAAGLLDAHRNGHIDARTLTLELERLAMDEPSAHKAPHWDCQCGIYAAKDYDYLLTQAASYTLKGASVGVVGVVGLEGLVIEHEHAYRAEFARIHRLVVSTNLRGVALPAARPVLDAVAEGLRQRYGVPTITQRELGAGLPDRTPLPAASDARGWRPDTLFMNEMVRKTEAEWKERNL